MPNRIQCHIIVIVKVLLFVLLAALQPFRPSTAAHAQSIDDGLIGYWPFDAGNPGADFSGNNHPATLGSGLRTTTNVAPTSFANTGALLSAPGANSYATATETGTDGALGYTIAFWLRMDAAANGTGDVLALGNRIVIQARKLQSGQFILDVRFPLRVYPYPVEAVFAENGFTGWSHIAVAIKGNQTDIYLNGQRAQNETYLAESSGTPTTGVYFSSPNSPLNGSLDDVRIYNRALNASEAAALPYNCNNSQGIPASECQALVNLFRDTNGMKWTQHTNWLQNNTPCTWSGVLCNNGHVFVLNLPLNNLTGPLTTGLGGLAELIVLNLSNNLLTGNIPFEWGNLNKLKTLDLYGNQLSGQIPFTLGGLQALTTLRLHSNQLSGSIPAQLVNLTALTTLDLGYNRLTAELPSVIDFLNNNQPDWKATQTLPPTQVKATLQSSNSVSVTWTPISYTADAGYYEVFSATQGSLYSSAGKTISKSISGLLVNGLTPGQNYSFVVRTFTPKHGLQQSDLLSDSSDPVTTQPVNQSPVATNDSYTTSQNTPLTIDIAHGLLANDSDPEGDKLKVGSISGINPGSQFALQLDGSFVYTPAANFVGAESFTYQASDGQFLSNPATIQFQVNPKPSNNGVTLTIALDVQPDSRTNFNFSGSLGAFLLDDITPQDGDAYSNAKTFNVAAGSYTITEQMISGYLDANISCNPTANTVADLARHQIVVNAAAGANITCTFVVQRAGQIIAGKYNDLNRNHARNNNEPWLNDWSMNLHSPFNTLTQTQVTSGEGRTTFGELFAGSYTVCETQQNGWQAITPNALNTTWKAPCYSVSVAPGQAVWTRFGNARSTLGVATAPSPGQPTIEDIVVCDLPPTDDNGIAMAPERDPWEEEEAAADQRVLYLPTLNR